MMPIGTSRTGLCASSDATVTVSKPIYAKKTSAVLARMPFQPKGANGCRLAGWTAPATAAKKTSIVDLQDDQCAIDAGRFADPDSHERRHHKRKERGEEIDVRMAARDVRALELRRKMEAEIAEQVLQVVGP